jgi:hypothetical protein
MMTGLSIRMGLLAIALISSSSGVSDDKLSSLNVASLCRMRSIADTPNKFNVRLISVSVGGVSKYLTCLGSTPRSSSNAKGVRDCDCRHVLSLVARESG